MGVKIYIIQEKYIDYLRESDEKVLKNKSEKRPYIGIVFKQGNFNYFSPLGSPKEKHKLMKRRLDFIKIRNGELGIINLNNSIPIKGNEIRLLDIDALKNSSNTSDRKYGTLCEDQLIWCDNNFEVIEKNFKKLYSLYVNNKLPESLKERCCNFSLLEEKSLDYHKGIQYNCLTGNKINIELHSSGDNKWMAKKDIEKFEIEKKEDAKEITADIYLKMSEKELKEYIKIKEKEETKNLSDEEKLYQVPITYYNISDLKITKEIEQKFVPMKEKKKTQEIDKSKGQGIGD